MVAMHEAFQSIVRYFSPRKSSHRDDSRISVFQYKFVFGALLACGILSGLTSWFARIECLRPVFNDAAKDYVEEWCYAKSTFVIRGRSGRSSVGNQHSSPFNTTVYISYYQWVTVVLFLQAAGFQIPRLIWKHFEGGRVRRMVEPLRNIDLDTPDGVGIAARKLANGFFAPTRAQSGRNYFNYFATCQFLYVVNAIAQIALTNAFLNDQFLVYLPMWLKDGAQTNVVFPKQVKCDFEFFAPSGVLQQGEVLCVLAMNVVFEKIYLCVWILLATALGAALWQNFTTATAFFTASVGHDDNSSKASLDRLQNSSDWLLLSFLKASVDPAVYDEFVNIICTPESDGLV